MNLDLAINKDTTLEKAEFIALSKEIEALKETLDAKYEQLNTLMTQLGLNSMFQDQNDGTVFKIVQPKGTFIEYRTIGYNRTKRAGEARGTLSAKDAEEAGFKVK